MGTIPLPIPWYDFHQAGHPPAFAYGQPDPCPLCVAEEQYEKWSERADEQLEEALSALRDPNETSDAVLSALHLAELAFRIALGETPEDEWTDEYVPVCICPPELVERGGFKGGCPVHALVVNVRRFGAGETTDG
jgi:hypothetical protein